MPGKRDIGLLIKNAALAAAGAGGFLKDGMANAGTSGKIGEKQAMSLGDRLKGALTAVSPALRQAQESVAKVNATSALTNLRNEQAQTLALKQEQANKPFDLARVIDQVDPTGKLSQQVQTFMKDAGFDIDVNGVITPEEFQKGIKAGLADMSQVSAIIDTRVGEMKEDAKLSSGMVDDLLAKVSVRGREGGLTREDFNNPQIARSYPKIAREIQDEKKLQSNIETLTLKSKMLASQSKMMKNETDAKTFARLMTSNDPEDRAFAKEMLKFKFRQGDIQTGAILFRGLVEEAPTAREGAMKANRTIDNINTMIELIDSGTGVTGFGGKMKAKIAGLVDTFGDEEDDAKLREATSNAELFRLLGRLVTGGMRLELLGSGSTSDFEQELMTLMSAGGSTSEKAARRLLNAYLGIAQEKIKAYNGIAETMGSIDNRALKAYPIIPTRTLSKQTREDMAKIMKGKPAQASSKTGQSLDDELATIEAEIAKEEAKIAKEKTTGDIPPEGGNIPLEQSGQPRTGATGRPLLPGSF